MRCLGICGARLLVLLACLAMAAGGAVAGRAHARAATPGLPMVICSGDGPVTVTLDPAGNPIETPDTEGCTCLCACCPPTLGPFVAPEADQARLPAPRVTPARPAPTPARPVLDRGGLPVPRGPPFQKDA